MIFEAKYDLPLLWIYDKYCNDNFRPVSKPSDDEVLESDDDIYFGLLTLY